MVGADGEAVGMGSRAKAIGVLADEGRAGTALDCAYCDCVIAIDAAALGNGDHKY